MGDGGVMCDGDGGFCRRVLRGARLLDVTIWSDGMTDRCVFLFTQDPLRDWDEQSAARALAHRRQPMHECHAPKKELAKASSSSVRRQRDHSTWRWLQSHVTAVHFRDRRSVIHHYHTPPIVPHQYKCSLAY